MMNEKLLKHILDVEEDAQTRYEAASKEAQLLPEQAEEQVKKLLEETSQAANLEGSKMMERICNTGAMEEIIHQYAERTKQRDLLAQGNMAKAVDFVIQTLLGKSNLK